MANTPGGTRRSFGNIRPLPSGRFQATYQGPDGVRRSAGGSFPTRKAAATWLEDAQADMRRGLWRRPELGAQRLDDYAIAWLTSREDLKPRTRDLYARLLDLHILPTLGPTQLDQITPQLAREWYQDLGARTGLTARAQAYRLLRTVLNQAVRDQALFRNPCVIPNGGSTRAAERVPATLAELDIIAAAVPARYRMLVLAGAWSGLRFGELTALRRRDVDLKTLAFTVTRGMHRVDGQWITTGPKSDAGRRTVHLPPHLRPGLVDHLDRFVGRSADALVFATRSGSPLGSGNWTQTFSRARTKADRDDLRFHDLRHTGATLAAQAGATTKELMTRIGHGSARAAMIYQHAAAERDQAIAAALSAAATSGNAGVPLQPRAGA